MTVWPHSMVDASDAGGPAMDPGVRAAPTPTPIRATTARRACRPTPSHISAWPRVRAQLSMASGALMPARSMSPSRTPDQPSVGAWTSSRSGAPGADRTAPGTPTPTPSSVSGSRPARAVTSVTPWMTSRATSYGSSLVSAMGCSQAATRVSDQSNRPVRMWVSPMSTPTTCPYRERTRSTERGLPPSELSSPASSTRPSAIRSETTLLTVAELSPNTRLSLLRLVGPWT